jgi:hypothetical protein
MSKNTRIAARDRIITLVQSGKLTPAKAEAEAKARGWPPFAQAPAWPAFDPRRESRWPLVVAIAWIAWRDLERTRQQFPAYRRERWDWCFCEWNKPVKRGTAFMRRAGWFLQMAPEQTIIGLQMLESYLHSRGELPSAARMTVAAAEQELWHALADSQLNAEALDETGKPVDVPSREWGYLKRFEEGNREVLKYGPLDSRPRFTQVNLKSRDLMRLWPSTPATMKAEHNCARWLAQQMAQSPTKRPKSRAAFWTDAKRQFRGLAKRQFDRAWDKAVAETGAENWSKAGRPKSNHRTN